ncbi:unnamed protein product [Linum trigynum]|uniref:Zinc knuckle CX2CX4HX4C domain-containing protein n=1 Tax=Linum trigynum TaxID=586398 RepID=A0AAV2DYF2_9ROSI
MIKPLPTQVRVDGAWQKVLYENIPQICYECGHIEEEDCMLNKNSQPLAFVPALEPYYPPNLARKGPTKVASRVWPVDASCAKIMETKQEDRVQYGQSRKFTKCVESRC